MGSGGRSSGQSRTAHRAVAEGATVSRGVDRLLVGIDEELLEHRVPGVFLLPQHLDDQRRDHRVERREVFTEGGDLADEAGAGVGEAAAGDDEGGLEPGDLAVGDGLLDLVLEVGEVADAAEKGGGADRRGVVDREAGERGDADGGGVGLGGDDLVGKRLGHLDAFFEGEELCLAGVVPHGDDELVEEVTTPADHVEVAEGDGVE